MTLAIILGFIEDPDRYVIKCNDHEVKFIDDYGLSCGTNGSFFVVGNEFGATHLIHASSYEDAWDAWLDEQPTIAEDGLIEAYSPGNEKGSFLDEAIDVYPGRSEGRWTEEDWTKIRASAKAALDAMASAASGPQGSGEYPELVEGYEFQSNTSGTGVVDVGHYTTINEADLSQFEVTPKEPEKKD